MRLYLVRHGETEWNRQRRIQGLTDLDLNENGRRQAEALARALRGEEVVAIFTSPLKRARYTASTIARFHGIEPEVLKGLRELDAGEVDGLTYEEMRERHGDFLEKWIQDCSAVAPPGGCGLPEIQEQACGAIEEIRSRHSLGGQGQDGRVAIAVAHFFPILSIFCKVLGIDLSECRRIRLDLASISTLELTPTRTVLVSMNDTCHLREGR